jgi:CheY-like chemotaxis protein
MITQNLLEQVLQPLLVQLEDMEAPDWRTATDSQNQAYRDLQKRNNSTAREWFTSESPGSLVGDELSNLGYLCTLPETHRRAVTYPVIGAWLQEKLDTLQSETGHQKQVVGALHAVIEDLKYCNGNTGYADPETQLALNARKDELTSLLFADVEESHVFVDFMRARSEEIKQAAEIAKSRIPKSKLQMDVYHGLVQPAGHFEYLVKYLLPDVDGNGGTYAVKPLNLTLMVVDDQMPERWYKQLLAVGFTKQKGKQGYFHDPEEALHALQEGQYDVVLSDIELGQGNMDGVTFAGRAYDIQASNGDTPTVAVFSFNQDQLSRARHTLTPSGNEPQKIMVEGRARGAYSKMTFTATEFREDVEGHLGLKRTVI